MSRSPIDRYGVVRYVAEVNGEFGLRFRVFTTNDDQFYLFSCIQNPDITRPVRKRDLQPDVRAALHQGFGYPKPKAVS